MAIPSRSLTFADLERIRETSDEQFELIEGALFVTPSPTPLHQMVSWRLSRLLDVAMPDPRVGLVFYAPLDVYFDDQNVLQPDLVVLLRDRIELVGEKNVQGPPSLAIEIVSPSTGGRDRGIKRDLYARYGVLEYWLVDPDARTVTIFGEFVDGHYGREEISSDVATSLIVPNLSANLTELFAPIRGG